MRITKLQTKRLIKKLGINPAAVSIETLQTGINVELEHGKRHGRTNVTNDSLEMSAIIALAAY